MTSSGPTSADIAGMTSGGPASSGPTIRRLEDPGVPWQRVEAQLDADGTESSAWEKWFALPDRLTDLRSRWLDSRGPADKPGG